MSHESQLDIDVTGPNDTFVGVFHHDTGELLAEISGSGISLPDVHDNLEVETRKVGKGPIGEEHDGVESRQGPYRVVDKEYKLMDFEQVGNGQNSSRAVSVVRLHVLRSEEYEETEFRVE